MLKACKAGMGSEVLRVNMETTKFTVPGDHDDHDALQKSGKYPRALCCSGVDRNSILCS